MAVEVVKAVIVEFVRNVEVVRSVDVVWEVDVVKAVDVVKVVMLKVRTISVTELLVAIVLAGAVEVNVSTYVSVV